MNVKISLSLNLFEPLSYLFTGDPSDITCGTRVLVPLGNRVVSGWVLGDDAQYRGSLKPVIGLIRSAYRPDEAFMRFVDRVAGLFRISPGLLLDYSLPPAQKGIHSLKTEINGRPLALAKAQPGQLSMLAASAPLVFFFSTGNDMEEKQALSPCPAPGFSESIRIGYERHESYRETIAGWTSAGCSAILLVPDNLTAFYWQERLTDVLAFHSDLRPRERDAVWKQACSGLNRAYAGSLSALFLPLPRPGGIIVDRSGCGSFHSSFHSGLDLPEVARIRAHAYEIPLIEGSAAHTLRSYLGRCTLPIEDTRPGEKQQAEVIPLKKGKKGIPAELLETLKEFHEQNRKTWIIISKKSGGTFRFCPKCQKVMACPSCQIPLPALSDGFSSCPGCGSALPGLTACFYCGGSLEVIRELGMDTLAEAIRREVSESGVMLLEKVKSNDLLALKEQVEQSRMVLSAPQLIPPHFKSIFDAIIYIRPESLFRMNRFKSAEQIFSTVAELRALIRAGGRLLLFSTYHFHYVFQLINREEDFWERELKYRQWFLLPPFFQVFRLEVRDSDLRRLAARMRQIKAMAGEKVRITRIFLVSRKKIRGYYRGQAEVHGWTQDLEAEGFFTQKSAVLTRINE